MMSIKPTATSSRNRSSAWLGRLQRTLVEPLAACDAPTLRRTALLLTIFLLALIGLFLLVDIIRTLTTPGYRPPWYGYLFFGGAYVLSRTRHHRLAAGLMITAFPLIIFITVVNYPESRLNTIVHYLVLNLFLASIFLSRRGLALIATVNIVALLILPILLPVAIPSYTPLVTPIAVNTIGAVLALIFVWHRDAVERDRQADLRASEERLRLALAAARMGTWDWDVPSGTVTASEQVAPLFGLRTGAFVDTYATYLDRIHPDDRLAVASAIAATLASASSDHHVVHRVLWPDGSVHWLEEHGRVYRDAAGHPLRLAGAVMDITMRVQAEEARAQAEVALRASEERYRVISEQVSDFAFAYQIKPEGAVLLEWITDAFTRITGYTTEEIRALEQWAACIHPADRAIAEQGRQRLLAGQVDISEYRIISKDGRTLWMRLYGRPVWDAVEQRVVRVYGAVQDITQVRQLEQQLNQAQKMEALGRLAGGIAHDFNNLLTVILGNVQLMLEAPPDIQSIQADAQQIQQAARHAAALTRQLLAFSRQQVLAPRHLDLNTVVRDMGQLVRRLIGEDIELVIQLAPGLGQVQADRGQLEQVIMNLAINARDAMPTGGTLTIETANIAVQDMYTQTHIGIERGSYTVLAISDTGVGMDAATRAQIFEPFFTTKAAGKGTGLGLATVHGIVTQSGGHIWVYSELGYGTTFKIYLPHIDTAEELNNTSELLAASQGDATILLVEDEPLVRTLAARMLRGYGYEILEAADGPAALRLASAYQAPIDLLLTDVIMPGGLNGLELATHMRAQRPAIKVLYMSGYTQGWLAQAIVDPGQAFMQKPFTPDSLARKVAEMLWV